MDCATFEKQLARSAADEADLEERAQLAEHASGCMPCRKMMQQSDEAQRALETALGSSKPDTGLLRSLGESLYAAKFGSTFDVETATRAASLAGSSAVPWLIGAGVGLLIGYLAWGGSGSTN